MFLQCNQPLESKRPPSSPPSMHLVSGLGDWTPYIDNRVSNPASILPLASPASQMRKKLPYLLLSSWGKVPCCDELTLGWGRVEKGTPTSSYPLWGKLGGILHFIIWEADMARTSESGAIFSATGEEFAEK